ncbi:MAG TPA: hypothetical protein VKR32_11395 [Puia sp.]|nr:hypothetical protein [Puia sp.]
MDAEIKYIELKSGYADDGPAWIGKLEFSKSGKSFYFNGHAFLGNGHGACYDAETGEEYWVSGVKKNGQDRHWAGKGKIMLDKNLVNEYLKLVNIRFINPQKYELVNISPTDKQKFNDLLNSKLEE